MPEETYKEKTSKELTELFKGENISPEEKHEVSKEISGRFPHIAITNAISVVQKLLKEAGRSDQFSKDTQKILNEWYSTLDKTSNTSYALLTAYCMWRGSTGTGYIYTNPLNKNILSCDHEEQYCSIAEGTIQLITLFNAKSQYKWPSALEFILNGIVHSMYPLGSNNCTVTNQITFPFPYNYLNDVNITDHITCGIYVKNKNTSDRIINYISRILKTNTFKGIFGVYNEEFFKSKWGAVFTISEILNKGTGILSDVHDKGWAYVVDDFFQYTLLAAEKMHNLDKASALLIWSVTRTGWENPKSSWGDLAANVLQDTLGYAVQASYKKVGEWVTNYIFDWVTGYVPLGLADFNWNPSILAFKLAHDIGIGKYLVDKLSFGACSSTESWGCWLSSVAIDIAISAVVVTYATHPWVGISILAALNLAKNTGLLEKLSKLTVEDVFNPLNQLADSVKGIAKNVWDFLNPLNQLADSVEGIAKNVWDFLNPLNQLADSVGNSSEPIATENPMDHPLQRGVTEWNNNHPWQTHLPGNETLQAIINKTNPIDVPKEIKESINKTALYLLRNETECPDTLKDSLDLFDLEMCPYPFYSWDTDQTSNEE